MADFTRDFLIFGSGVAGLWLFNDLAARGYDVSLIEAEMLGGTQTLGSQGMIHGGQKYTLTGNVDDVASNVAKMPALWVDCLKGKGLIDLSAVEVLAEAQVMWPDYKLMSGAASFAAAKSVNGETEALHGDDLPEVLKRHKVKTGYALHEVVMNTKSLISALAAGKEDSLHKATLTDIVFDGEKIDHVVLQDDDEQAVTVKARKYIFACGKGNEEIVRKLGETAQVAQRRPLRQVMAKGLPHPLFGHCVTVSPKPRVTVTSYKQNDGSYIWYLGGAVAEAGVKMDKAEHRAVAAKEMKDIFPQLDWNAVQWSTWNVDRAEAFDPNGHLPPGPQIGEYGDAFVVWPTKMTFAPALSLYADKWCKAVGAPSSNKAARLPFNAPAMGAYPWEETEWHDVS